MVSKSNATASVGWWNTDQLWSGPCNLHHEVHVPHTVMIETTFIHVHVHACTTVTVPWSLCSIYLHGSRVDLKLVLSRVQRSRCNIGPKVFYFLLVDYWAWSLHPGRPHVLHQTLGGTIVYMYNYSYDIQNSYYNIDI